MKFTLFALAGVALAKTTQVAVLFDTTRLGPISSSMPKMLSDAVSVLLDEGDHEFALASFSDKPAPYAGIGAFADYPGPYAEDYCYHHDLAFTTSATEFTQALTGLIAAGGLDVWQAQFEAAIRAVYDTKLNWKADADKIILMVTDSFGHVSLVDGLAERVTGFNEPVRCQNGQSRGGFGAMSPGWPTGGWVWNTKPYEQYAELHYKRACVADLTAEEQATYDKLRDTFPIRQYPAVQDFDLELLKSNPDEHCRYNEYPFYDDVTDAMNNNGISLFILFHDPSSVSAQSSGDDAVWAWAVGDSWGLGDIKNVYEHIPNLAAITSTAAAANALAETDVSSLEGILRTGFKALST